jgi:hypothetical protein
LENKLISVNRSLDSVHKELEIEVSKRDKTIQLLKSELSESTANLRAEIQRLSDELRETERVKVERNNLQK